MIVVTVTMRGVASGGGKHHHTVRELGTLPSRGSSAQRYIECLFSIDVRREIE